MEFEHLNLAVYYLIYYNCICSFAFSSKISWKKNSRTEMLIAYFFFWVVLRSQRRGLLYGNTCGINLTLACY